MITIFSGGPGLHHNFLRFTLDYLSRLTPNIEEYPFTDSGTSHKKIIFSKKFDLIQGVDFVDKSIESCISIEADDLLYYQRIGLARESSKNIDLQNLHNFEKWHEWNKHWIDQIYDCYKIDKEEKLCKFIIRDSVKKGYLDRKNLGLYKQNTNVITQVKNLSNSYILPVSSFFSLESYKYQLQKIDQKYDLDLCFDNLPKLYEIFYDKNYVLQTHQIVFDILNSIEEKKFIHIPALDVFQEGYIYAMLESTNNSIIMPLVDSFFTNTEQVINYIKYFPDHYKIKNPNLTIVNKKP